MKELSARKAAEETQKHHHMVEAAGTGLEEGETEQDFGGTTTTEGSGFHEAMAFRMTSLSSSVRQEIRKKRSLRPLLSAH